MCQVITSLPLKLCHFEAYLEKKKKKTRQQDDMAVNNKNKLEVDLLTEPNVGV